MNSPGNSANSKRRQFIGVMISTAIVGPSGMMQTAQANPLVWWILRGVFGRGLIGRSVARGAASSAARAATRRQIGKAVARNTSRAVGSKAVASGAGVSLLAQTIGAEAAMRLLFEDDSPGAAEDGTPNYYWDEDGVDPMQGIEQWDGSTARSLYLEIPPSEFDVSDTLLVSLLDLENDGQHDTIVGESPLTLLRSHEPVILEVPVGRIHMKGVFAFHAVVPGLYDQVAIEATPPVMIR